MRKEIFSTVVIAALAAEASACNTTYTQPADAINTNEPHTTLPTQVPTFMPHIRPGYTPTAVPTNTEAPSPTPTPEWKAPLDQRFSLGKFGINKTGFKIDTTMPLMTTMGFIGNQEFIANEPVEVTTNYFPFVGDQAFGTLFEKSGQGNGMTPLLFLTDNPNILMLYAHSEDFQAPGEISRIIGSFLLKHPDQEANIYGKEIIFNTNDGKSITGTIEFVKTVTDSVFQDQTSDATFWGLYQDKDNILFLRTDNAGIPDSIRNDKTPGVKYLIITACTPQNGDPINLNIFDHGRDAFNTANRTMVVIKFTNQ